MSENNGSDTPIIDDTITDNTSDGNSLVDAPISGDISDAVPQELDQAIDQALEDGASKEEIKQMIEEFELKVNGKTVKRKLDLNDKEAIKKALQLAEVSHLSMQQKRELEKGIEDEVKRLLKDPRSVLKEMGLDTSKLAEDWLTDEVNEMKKSPEQVSREKMEKELNEMRSKLKKQEEDAFYAKKLQIQHEEGMKLKNEIDTALSSYTSLPNSPKTVARIADTLLFAIDNAVKLGIDASKIRVEDVLPSVEAEIKAEMEGFFNELPEDAFEAWIGKKNLDRARKKRLEAAKTSNLSNLKSTASKQEPKEEVRMDRMKRKDYFKNLGKK